MWPSTTITKTEYIQCLQARSNYLESRVAGLEGSLEDTIKVLRNQCGQVRSDLESTLPSCVEVTFPQEQNVELFIRTEQ